MFNTPNRQLKHLGQTLPLSGLGTASTPWATAPPPHRLILGCSGRALLPSARACGRAVALMGRCCACPLLSPRPPPPVTFRSLALQPLAMGLGESPGERLHGVSYPLQRHGGRNALGRLCQILRRKKKTKPTLLEVSSQARRSAATRGSCVTPCVRKLQKCSSAPTPTGVSISPLHVFI